MRRLVILVLMLALALANGPAMAAAMCAHADVDAHVSAREGGDGMAARAALAEEVAGKSVSRHEATPDSAAAALAGCILPRAPEAPFRLFCATAPPAPMGVAILAGRSEPPLLKPPPLA
ncbi:hypothetical protein [Allosphingosinicella deserti]|uniref:Uncharacterized protein n=1 Tax=Allosphingosinicella deserti TaxID=2116704 RepID=A0A2P7QVP9_9SPHN|nr:hypothetical protein [Sphingomonas deserti]PSJ42036.1 hypothetical protein C7I55_07235 [Sphingomonas deserti]